MVLSLYSIRMINILFLLLLPISCFSQPNSILQNYTAIFSFGDSFADTGNLGLISSSIAQMFFPYGVTFFHHPTGRCSDGRLVLDFIAEAFGLPFVEPYWRDNITFISGANFAVTGATALDYEFYVENNLTSTSMLNTSLDVQLAWFDQLKPSLCATPKKCVDYFGRSLFFLGEIGANDYAFMSIAGMSVEETRGYVPMVIEKIFKSAESLIKNGVLTLVIPGMGPRGCTPMNLAQNTSRPENDYELETGCLKEFNELSAHHNSLLLKAVKQLRVKYPYVKLIYAEYYRPILDFIKSPDHYGFIGTPLRTCCGKGENQYNYNKDEVCGMRSVDFCKIPSSYLYWDGVHLTEAAYHHIANGWLNGTYTDPPIQPMDKVMMNIFSSK